MIIAGFPNYRVDDGIITRGFFETGRKKINPDLNGKYCLKRRGEAFYMTMDEITSMRPVKQEFEAPVQPKRKLVDVPKLIEDYLLNKSGSETAREHGIAAVTANDYFRKFGAWKNFKTICDTLNIGDTHLLTKFPDIDNIKELDKEDRLRLIARYIRMTKPVNRMCEEQGISYNSFRGWVKYNYNALVNSENFDKYAKLYTIKNSGKKI